MMGALIFSNAFSMRRGCEKIHEQEKSYKLLKGLKDEIHEVAGGAVDDNEEFVEFCQKNHGELKRVLNRNFIPRCMMDEKFFFNIGNSIPASVDATEDTLLGIFELFRRVFGRINFNYRQKIHKDTMLMRAAAYGDKALVLYLLSCNTDLKIKDALGRTAIDYAYLAKEKTRREIDLFEDDDDDDNNLEYGREMLGEYDKIIKIFKDKGLKLAKNLNKLDNKRIEDFIILA